jgi:predicted nuclease of predicted toxin-antitoxin system
VSVRLLLDENLSERLLPLLAERFPGSRHVRQLGLGGASDLAIWDRARQEGYGLVTKDEDFLSLSVARGVPPVKRHLVLALRRHENWPTRWVLHRGWLIA